MKNISDDIESQKIPIFLINEWAIILYKFYLIHNKQKDRMRSKRQQKYIKLQQPFLNQHNNWELITSIQSSLNKYLIAPSISLNIDHQQPISTLHLNQMESLIAIAKNVVKSVEVLKNQQKYHEQIRLQTGMANQKLQQHQAIFRNLQKNYSERTKNLVEENKMLKENNQKLKKVLNQYQDNSRQAIDAVKRQNEELKSSVLQSGKQRESYLKVISSLQREIQSQKQIIQKYKDSYEIEEKIKSTPEKVGELIKYNKLKIKPVINEQLSLFVQNTKTASFLIFSQVTIASTILAYLPPKQISHMFSLDKSSRILLTKSKHCLISLCRSIGRVKNRQIKYYHEHILHFQRLYNKIPEQILQTTYFQAHILKQSIGSDIMNVLNRSALIFEGKFIGEECGQQQLVAGIPAEYKPNRDLSFIDNRCREAFYLEVDEELIAQFMEEKKSERQTLIKELDAMYHKITDTLQLYSIDTETCQLFYKNVLKNFTKVFVLSKNLYSQMRNLQQLNTFLLHELSAWDKMEIDKKHKIEDLRAELQSQQRLKMFFTQKSIKSEQKALIEENMKLTYEMKWNKLQELMNSTIGEKDELSRRMEVALKNNKALLNDNKELKRAYEVSKEKYNKIIEELTVVKETIVRMNIL